MNYLRATALEVAAQALNHSCTRGVDNADVALRRSPIQQNPPKFHAVCGWMAGAPLILPFTACNAATASAAAACRYGCVRVGAVSDWEDIGVRKGEHRRVSTGRTGAASPSPGPAPRRRSRSRSVATGRVAGGGNRGGGGDVPPPTAHRRHSQS